MLKMTPISLYYLILDFLSLHFSVNKNSIYLFFAHFSNVITSTVKIVITRTKLAELCEKSKCEEEKINTTYNLQHT